MPFHVLFVCTGNICRSPVAERLLLSGAAGAVPPGVTAASAGTRALVGHGIDAVAQAVLREHGADPAGHLARQLSVDLIRSAQLVLSASAAHRADVLRVDPLALPRTFTLREFGRLAHELIAGDGPASSPWHPDRVAELAALRDASTPAARPGEDVADPFGAPIPVMRSCVAAIERALAAGVAALGAPPRAVT